MPGSQTKSRTQNQTQKAKTLGPSHTPKKLSQKEMQDMVEKKRKEKGIPNTVDQYEWLNRRRLTPVQKQAKHYLESKRIHYDPNEEAPIQNTLIAKKHQEYQEHQENKAKEAEKNENNSKEADMSPRTSKRDRKPSNTYPEDEYVRNHVSPIRSSPPKKTDVQEIQEMQEIQDDIEEINEEDEQEKDEIVDEPRRSPRHKQNTKPDSMSRNSRSTRSKSSRTSRTSRTPKQSKGKQPDKTTSMIVDTPQENEDQDEDENDESEDESTISFSLIDDFGNSRNIEIDLQDKTDTDQTLEQLLDEQGMDLKDRQIVVDSSILDSVPQYCRPDNMVSICVKNGSVIYLEDTMITVSFASFQTVEPTIFQVPSFTKIHQIKHLLGVPSKMRLFLKSNGLYLSPSSSIGRYVLPSDVVELRTDIPITVKSSHRVGETFIAKELPLLETVDNLFEKYFRSFFPQSNSQTGYLCYKRQNKVEIIPPFGYHIEDILQQNDEILMQDLKLTIDYEIPVIENSGQVEVQSSFTMKDILKKLKINHQMYDVVRCFDNEVLHKTDIVAKTLMPGYTIKIMKKRVQSQNWSQSVYYFIQKGRELKMSKMFDQKTSTVFDFVQYLNQEHPLSPSQQWSVAFKNDANECPLNLYYEEANIAFTIYSEAILRVTSAFSSLHLRLFMNGVIVEKHINPFLLMKDTIKLFGYCPNFLENDVVVEQPSEMGKRQICDPEKDLLALEQNSLLFIEKKGNL